MTKSISHLSSAHDDALTWLELDRLVLHRELASIEGVLLESCARVIDEARAKSLRLVPVPVSDEVLIARAHVVFVLAMLLRGAISSTPAGARVAITGQPMERDLVFAVYDSGPQRTPPTLFSYIVRSAALTIGGRVWAGRSATGNLTLFALPLFSGAN